MARRNSHDYDEFDLYPKQAVSLARRMAGKKGAVVQLQAEVNSEDDWDKLLLKDGLIVVDVYSDWCGPCVGMIGNLKKCKLEIGGDMLHLAIAKSDEIEILKRFRNKSEPTWMFIAGGQLLNVMFGANAPKLMQMIESQLKNEQKVLKGEVERQWYPFDKLTPIEQERFEASELLRIAEEKAEAARRLIARNEDRNRRFNLMQHQMTNETVVICMPHTLSPEGCILQPLLEPIWLRIGVTVIDIAKAKITYDMWEEIFYREEGSMSEDMAKNLEVGPAMALLIHKQANLEQPFEPGEIEKLVCEALYEVELEPGQEIIQPHPDSIPAQYYWKRPKDEETISEKSVEDFLKKPKKDDEMSKKSLGKNETKSNGVDDGSKKGSKGAKVEEEEINQEEEDRAVLTKIQGLYTASSAFAKCAAFSQMFPARAEKVALAAGAPQLPPRVAMIFEPSKAEQCYIMAQDLADEVLYMGFFDKGDPDEANLLAKTHKHYCRLSQAPENRLVIVVAKRRSEPMLSFATLGPLYVSPDVCVGAQESDKFFPPGLDLDPEQLEDVEENDDQSENWEDDDEEEILEHVHWQQAKLSQIKSQIQVDDEEEDDGDHHGRGSEISDGGLTPTTAVTGT